MLLVLAIVMATLYLIYPEAYSGVAAKISDALGGGPKAAAEMSVKQAKFVNLDGRVQVKKVNSVQWVAADYRMALDKGDLIQTSGDGAARVTFADGTTYTVQADTLVTVEENSVGRDSETRVAMHISSGAVDLTTGTWDSPKSKAEVSFSNAVASVKQTSRAPPCAAIRRPTSQTLPCPPVRRSWQRPMAASMSRSGDGSASPCRRPVEL